MCAPAIWDNLIQITLALDSKTPRDSGYSPHIIDILTLSTGETCHYLAIKPQTPSHRLTGQHTLILNRLVIVAFFFHLQLFSCNIQEILQQSDVCDSIQSDLDIHGTS